MAQKKQTRSSKDAAEKENEIRHDKVLWSTLLFALGVLTLAFMLIPGESVWNSIHNVLLGLFGVSVFLVPVIMIYVSIMIALDKGEHYVSVRVLQCFVLILLLSGFVQIVFSGELQGEKLFDEILPIMFSEGKKLRGGGLLSIIIAGPLLALFKRTGATIIIILFIFVFIMIMANKTVIDLFKMIRNAANKASAARAKNYKETEDFIAPPGAKKAVPNADVPENAAKEKQKNFNIDIPIPSSKKLSRNEQVKATGTLTEPPKDLAEPENISPIPESAPKIEDKKVETDKQVAKETMKHASSELDDIIKKAASVPPKPTPKTCPDADEQGQLKKDIANAIKKKQSTMQAIQKLSVRHVLPGGIKSVPALSDNSSAFRFHCVRN